MMEKSQAITRVQEHLLADAKKSGEKSKAYIMDSPLDTNDIPRTIAGPIRVDSAENLFVPNDPAEWMFFVDDDPEANWEHNCRYLFVHSNGKITEVPETAPPSTATNQLIKEIPLSGN